MSSSTDMFNAHFNGNGNPNQPGSLAYDAEQFSAMQIAATQADQAYGSSWNQLLAKAHGNPELLYVLIIYLLSVQGQKEMDAHLAVQGASLKVQGDITQLNNDLQNLTNSNSANPQDVKNYASHLDDMLGVLEPGATNAPAWAQDVRSALNMDNGGSSGAESTSGYLASSFLTLRNQVYWAEDPNANANPNVAYNPDPTPAPASGPRTYYFNPDDPVSPTPYSPTNDTNYISNFADLHTYMQSQGDLDQATEAAKAMSDQFNMVTSTTQSTNAASDTIISQEKNTISTVTSFTTNMMHSMMDQIKVAINNQISR